MNCFCTVITKSHLVYAKAIHRSLKNFLDNVNMEVLIVDDDDTVDGIEGFNSFGLNSICNFGLGKEIYRKYGVKKMDRFRWSMKPVLMNYLLSEKYDQVIYVDSDVYFFANPKFLIEKLKTKSILISPHWRCSNNWVSFVDFVRNHTHGLFNGGFVGANKKGMPALEWWAKSCLESCEIDYSKGLYVDQAYLGLMPVLFDDVEILKHKGCNVANWNKIECKRVRVDDKVLINKDFEIVFIHWTHDTLKGVFNGEDPELKLFFEEYAQTLNSIEKSCDLYDKYNRKSSFFNLFNNY